MSFPMFSKETSNTSLPVNFKGIREVMPLIKQNLKIYF